MSHFHLPASAEDASCDASTALTLLSRLRAMRRLCCVPRTHCRVPSYRSCASSRLACVRANINNGDVCTCVRACVCAPPNPELRDMNERPEPHTKILVHVGQSVPATSWEDTPKTTYQISFLHHKQFQLHFFSFHKTSLGPATRTFTFS